MDLAIPTISLSYYAKFSTIASANDCSTSHILGGECSWVLYTKEYMKTHPEIDYFLYGHRHIELDIMLSRKSRMMILGDWIWQFTYAVFDGEHMFLEEYVEGESQP